MEWKTQPTSLLYFYRKNVYQSIIKHTTIAFSRMIIETLFLCFYYTVLLCFIQIFYSLKFNLGILFYSFLVARGNDEETFYDHLVVSL